MVRLLEVLHAAGGPLEHLAVVVHDAADARAEPALWKKSSPNFHTHFFLRGSARPFPAYLLQVAALQYLETLSSSPHLITRTPEPIPRSNLLSLLPLYAYLCRN
jgi:hypothetical protein